MKFRTSRQALGLVEVILALSILLVAFLFVFSSFAGSARHAVQSRNRKLAILTAKSALEEVLAHPFGTAAPAEWPLEDVRKVNYTFIVSGRPQLAEFSLEMKLENGSLVGKGEQQFDRVTVLVGWHEGGPKEIKAELLVAPTGFQEQP